MLDHMRNLLCVYSASYSKDAIKQNFFWNCEKRGQKSREQNILRPSVQHFLWKPALNLPKVSHLKDWKQTNSLADKDLWRIYSAGGSNCLLPPDCINKHAFSSKECNFFSSDNTT